MNNGILKVIVEKGRFAQWLGIIMAGVVAVWGGVGGWLSSGEIVKIVLAGLGIAGGIEAMKLLKGTE